MKSVKEIKSEMEDLRELVRHGKFEGHYARAYAISHAQVSTTPKHFFVINEDIETEIDGKKYTLKQLFGHWCIINAEILNRSMPIEWEDACMSFPWRKPKRIERYAMVKAAYWIPFLGTWRKKEKMFKGLPALILQHELEHALGKNIYNF